MSTSNVEKQYLFYRSPESRNALSLGLDDNFRCEVWRPSLRSLWPTGTKVGRAWRLARWLMHYLHVFATREYSMFVIRKGGRLVHQSAIHPRYFRTPAMNKDDLMIGNVWTDPQFRGRGLAVYAIQEIVRLKSKPGRFLWYITRKGKLAVNCLRRKGRVGQGRGGNADSPTRAPHSWVFRDAPAPWLTA